MPRRAVQAAIAAGATLLVVLIVAVACWPAGDSNTNTPAAPPPTQAAANGPQGPPSLSLADLGVKLAYERIEKNGMGTLVIHLPDDSTMDVDGANGVFTGIAWSPDGQKIAVSFGPTPEQQDIWVVDSAGQNLTRLTKDGHSRRPTWSPDGQTLAFTSAADATQGHGPIFTMPVNGNAGAALSKDPRHDDPAWAPDGSSIAVSREPGTVVLLAPATGAELKQVNLLRDSDPTYSSFDWSSDSTALAGVVARGTDLAIVVLQDNLTSQRQVGGAFLGSPSDPASAHPSWVPGFPKLIAASEKTGDLLLVDVLASPNDVPSDAPYSPVQTLVPAPRGSKLAFPAVYGPRPAGGASRV
jgi:dipeptidyl aminopeptidase/acylaminoacyl peptidase